MTSAVSQPVATRPFLTRFLIALVAGWLILAASAEAFATTRQVPATITIPLALAFLTEYSFYLLLGFGAARAWLIENLSRKQLAGAIGASAILPYLIFSCAPGTFRPLPALCWIGISATVSICFLNPIRSKLWAGVRDLAFLSFLAALIISGALRWIFPIPFPKIPMEVLGHVTLVRSAILSILLLRGTGETGIGFVLRWRDLAIGALWFVACLATATPLGIALEQLHLATRRPVFLPSIALVLGVFWVLALSEEFFFRGLLQPWLTDWTGSRAAALILASFLFAACHLGFRGAFPNWRVASLSLILGLCCGAAFLHSGTIRASMVTHTLAVCAWRLLLS